ncbi:mannose-6-phosphate isomerase-like protein (cupin superfamily) [Methylosinus sp. sav-2]|uniref:cupin domain-containing protein n=1 Tax=Methylosinus sp. sav-2 TaxID=2485168 RepID=UPI000A7882C4|nr:cupin domain-containing protein [Methylosinus sp. sav-2]TDX65594.1 mannose-6-phosphate isomerase-like protein (cupin superfamily) [Methylosinus sp. sav-2]
MQMSVVGKEDVEHYLWGGDCEGWRFVDRRDLGVILELMPAGRAETRHVHEKARQFFFVLRGALSFEIAGVCCVVTAGKGVEIAPGAAHRVRNDGDEDAEFLVIAHPSTRGDRIEAVD